MKTLKVLLATGLLAGLGGFGFLYSGWYPMGADVPHNAPTYWALDTLRERSIARSIRDIEVPPLDNPQMLLAGGADYNDMCAGCHLKPGEIDNEISQGLYPRPPNLAISAEAHHPAGGNEGDGHGIAKNGAARQFWIIKHGIKASGMAAFGKTHDDARIWAMVAFLQKLPTLTPSQYQILTARAEGDMGHEEHGSGGEGEHDGMDMSGMSPSGVNTEAARMAQDVVDAFQTALKSGDARAALAWLAPDVLIYEGGGAERSRNEYAAHHLQADMAFLKTSRAERLKRSSGDSGDAAWVTTEMRVRGKSSKGSDIDVLSAETALLRKTPQGWRITHMHWSSQDYKAPTPTPTN